MHNFSCPISSIRKRLTIVALVALTTFSAVEARADHVTSGTTTPAPGSTVDGCSGCLFNYTAAPSGSVGEAVVSWSFYAANTNPVTPVIFNSSGVVVGVGNPVTPTGVGVQTATFGTVSGSSVIGAGDTLGWFYSGQGSVAVSLNGGPGVNQEAGYGGIRAGDTINTSQIITNRTYYVNYTTAQVTLGTAQAPGPGAISDGCSYCLFQYDQVTSQYNGETLTSWSFYAMNTNPVVPVIFGPDGTIIGFGTVDTPTGTGLQTFAYVPDRGSAVLQTGDTLGWYVVGTGGPIAFTLTGGTGASYAPFPVPSLGLGDYTTTQLPNRDYAVGYTISPLVAQTPEPVFLAPAGMVLSAVLAMRRKRK